MQIAQITQIPTAPMLADDTRSSGADVFFRKVDDSEVLLTVSFFLISIIRCSNSPSVMLFEFFRHVHEHIDGVSVVLIASVTLVPL
jgi:hypothetical protein